MTLARFDRDNLPSADSFGEYRRTTTTRIAGPFDDLEVRTREGDYLITDGPGYLALDSNGDPYPIAADVFEAIYEPAEAQRAC